jgi:hypothetical protein
LVSALGNIVLARRMLEMLRARLLVSWANCITD